VPEPEASAAEVDELRFGEFRLLRQQRQLLRGTVEQALTACAFTLLEVLADRAGQLVGKDELMQRVWGSVVVEENNLAVQVGVLRKLLGAGAIVTVPGRGYRFAWPLLDTEPAKRQTNLPASAPPLVGRDDEGVALQGLLQAQRLVTIVGAGGIGKSRLAQAAAMAAVGSWPDGVWWVELAGLADAALLPQAVAQVLGLSLPSREATPGALASALAGHRALLVIDNCEHLIDAVAALVDALLHGAAGLHVLATSQEPLRLPAEQQLRLDPLAIPAAASTPNARQFGALALLVARVRATAPAYELSDDELPLAIELCRSLDGLPLAIELAAARVPLLGLRTVHDRLDERFRLLTAGSRTALRRHQTLHAALAWSHGLLDDAQRAVFRRLGVFSGGFTLELAQALCADAQRDDWAVLEQLAALVEKSLVVHDGAAQPRYRLLESARAFALEQLAAAGETGDAIRRHAQVMLNALRHVDDANLDGELRTDQYAARVLPELDNLRAAYAWASGKEGDPAIAIGLPAHISPLIDYSLEFVDWVLAQRPRMAEGLVDELTTARFCRTLAASNLGGFVSMREQRDAAEKGAELYRHLDRPKRVFSCLRRASVWAVQLKDFAAARRAVEACEALIEPDWGPEFRIEVLRGRSHLADFQGDLDAAISLRQDAVRVARDVFGDWRLEVIDATCVADLMWRAGRHGEAAQVLDDVIERMRVRPASDYELLDALETRLWILSDRGELSAARSLARQALPVMRRMPRFALVGCAHLLARLGRFEDAARVLGAEQARVQSGLAPVLSAGLSAGASALTRLQAEALAAAEAALAPAQLAALRSAGAALGYAEVCNLLAEAVQDA
jgi:predicted ATPase/DNA-binding winged helix-turn-helix (wHTH) protein